MRHTLKTLALATGVSLIALGTGFAADLGNRPAYKAPPMAAPMFSWTGLYIGAHLGYGWGDNDFGGLSHDSDGFMGGLQAGYDWQFSPNWVLGIESQVSFSDISGSAGTDSTDLNWLSSVTGRLGFTPGGNWLVYGKGGVAWGDFDHTIAVPGVTVINSETRIGWTAGAGIEYAFAPGWSGKIEYQYYDFGSESYDFSPAVGGTGIVDVDSTIHTVKAGINWRFGGLGGRY